MLKASLLLLPLAACAATPDLGRSIKETQLALNAGAARHGAFVPCAATAEYDTDATAGWGSAGIWTGFFTGPQFTLSGGSKTTVTFTSIACGQTVTVQRNK